MTFLLVAGMIWATLREHWALAGVMAGGLIYKPQFALGFLLLWFIWGKWRALVGFASVAGVWVGASYLIGGLGPYLDYLNLGSALLELPYVDGFPSFIMVTPYGLLATALPKTALPWLQRLSQVWGLVLTSGLAWLGWRARGKETTARTLALAAALLYPLLTMPYTLLHDLLLLVLVLLLLDVSGLGGRSLRMTAALAYAGALFLPLIGYTLGVALPALIPLWVTSVGLRQVLRRKSMQNAA